MVTIKLDRLFDSQVVSFHKELEAMCVDPKVIAATSINPKLVGGRLFLNATSHVYFDKKTYAGEVRFYQYVIRLLNVYMCIDTIRLPNHSMVRRLVARGTGLPSAAPPLRSNAKVETMTMAELNAAVVNAASQEIDVLRIGRVVRLDTDKGWCYAACSKCSKKLQPTTSAFAYGRCNNLHGAGALRCSKQWDKMNSRLLLGCYLSLWITLIICL
ncbi:PREDICTED: uncharacterized protein LOC106305632 isoform X1 [Brassica oleracea var. oleracea]|uniref:uncharacterized protein LOC106305632 isoform X1 n=2 Tax=Brassica oleracea var. oleracea TaxID=109376 RepID=UPI0006A6AFEC|nr:PREDICTED: uncharacterized protein LOC106305632 isoform X1 [Brassica oleracea var. oleracea]XP_013597440.1 PREDICTED: uncharacterized protein LOC106305632 isoform X1 [Brassica oleracea var. oleracea]